MEFLSDTALPWLCGFIGWFSASLRTEVAAAWAQAIFSVGAIIAAIKIARAQSRDAEEQSAKQHRAAQDLADRQHEESLILFSKGVEAERLRQEESARLRSYKIMRICAALIDDIGRTGQSMVERLNKPDISIQNWRHIWEAYTYPGIEQSLSALVSIDFTDLDGAEHVSLIMEMKRNVSAMVFIINDHTSPTKLTDKQALRKKLQVYVDHFSQIYDRFDRWIRVNQEVGAAPQETDKTGKLL